jgi:AraC-like DNA-binding protein
VYYKRLLPLHIEAELRAKETINVSNILQEYEVHNLSQFGASFKHYFSKTPSEVEKLSENENPFAWNEKIFLEFSEL